MKYIYIKLLFLGFIFIGLTSCENYLGGDFNDNPNKVTAVSLQAMFPVAVESTSDLHYKIAFTTSQVTQQMYGGGASDHGVFTLASSWTEAYLVSMNNLNQLIIQAQEENLPHYEGMAQVLMALNLGIVTDNWESAPFNEAFSGFDIPKPAYDSQESIYASIASLLNDGIANLSTPDVEGLEPGSDDLVYDGDMIAWVKFAYALKARYAIHLSNKGGSAAGDALSALGNAFTSNDDDFELVYNAVNRNPWHTTPVLANNTGNITIWPGAYFIDNLNGVNFPLDGLIEDPRVRVLTNTTADNILEPITGGTLDGNVIGNANLDEGTYYTTESAPLSMISYVELKFIEAEAELMNGNSGNAYNAYLEGIAANMDKVGVDATSRDTYLADANVAVGSGGLTLALIMKEKYIALFLNPEVWVDMRRHSYSTTIYPNLAPPPPGIQSPDVPEGSFPQRALYPLDEYNRNNENATSSTKDFAVKMWRDQ